MQYCISRSSQRHDNDHGILECLTGHDVTWLDIFLQQITDRLARLQALFQLAGIDSRNRGTVRQAHTQRLDCRGHGVGRIHAAAGTGAGTGMLDNHFTIMIVDLAGDVFTITLKCRDDIQGRVFPVSRLNGTAIDHQRWPVDASHGDQHTRHILVTARNGNIGVIPLGIHYRFNRVRNDVARLQRITHAVGTHGDAVTDTNGIETHANQAGGLDPLLDLRGQVVEVHIAGVALPPDAGDADLGLLHVFGRQPGAIQHGLGRALGAGLSDTRTESIQFFCHFLPRNTRIYRPNESLYRPSWPLSGKQKPAPYRRGLSLAGNLN